MTNFTGQIARRCDACGGVDFHHLAGGAATELTGRPDATLACSSCTTPPASADRYRAVIRNGRLRWELCGGGFDDPVGPGAASPVAGFGGGLTAWLYVSPGLDYFRAPFKTWLACDITLALNHEWAPAGTYRRLDRSYFAWLLTRHSPEALTHIVAEGIACGMAWLADRPLWPQQPPTGYQPPAPFELGPETKPDFTTHYAAKPKALAGFIKHHRLIRDSQRLNGVQPVTTFTPLPRGSLCEVSEQPPGGQHVEHCPEPAVVQVDTPKCIAIRLCRWHFEAWRKDGEPTLEEIRERGQG